MDCPHGTHTHLGADGKTQLKCHDVSIKHTNPTAQMYHQMAVQQSQGSQMHSDADMIADVKANETQQNWAKVARNLKQIFNKLNGRNKNRLIPLSAILFATEKMYSSYKKYAQSDDATQTGYERGFKALYRALPKESKYIEYSAKEFESVISKVDKRIEQLLNDPKSHKKGTVEYGELLCYWQYLQSAKKAIERGYAMSEMKGEDIKSDHNYDVVNRAMQLARKRAQARTSSLRDAIQRRPPTATVS